MSFFKMSFFNDFSSYLSTTQWIRVSVVLYVVLVGIGYAVGFSIGSQKARDTADADYSRRVGIFSAWQLEIVSQFTRAEALASTMASFAVATATEYVNLSLPVSDRLDVRSPEAFDMMCTDLTSQLPGIYAILLAPHGVIAHVFPPKSVPIGFDFTSSPTYASSFNIMYATGKPVVAGPTRMVTVKGGISLTAWYPLFVNGSTVPRTKDTFWGALAALLLSSRGCWRRKRSSRGWPPTALSTPCGGQSTTRRTARTPRR